MENTRFDINHIQKQYNDIKTEKTVDFSAELLEKATKAVLEEITNIKGTQDEIELHNAILHRCVNGDKMAQRNIKAMIKKIIEKDYALAMPPLSDILVKRIYEDNFGLGPIDDLFNNPEISEIWVNGWDHVWIEKGGIASRVDRKFKNDDDVMRIIRLLLQFDKKDITKQNPAVECRMLDGSRLTVLIPPVAKKPSISIRKFEAFDTTTENMIQKGTATPEVVAFLEKIVKGRANILVIGETGSGKTSLIKWLVGFMNPKLRLGVIETTFELKLDEKFSDRNIFSFEEHLELGIDMNKLFKECLRSRPDIIICGEARGEEADELIKAMRRGHEGSISSIHTNSAETAISDLAEMINEDGKRRDPELLLHRIASAIDIIIQIKRFDKTGNRKLVKITEIICEPDSFKYQLNDIFAYEVNRDNPELGEFIKKNAVSDRLKKKFNNFGLPYEELSDL